jgi:hypothetical protein
MVHALKGAGTGHQLPHCAGVYRGVCVWGGGGQGQQVSV